MREWQIVFWITFVIMSVTNLAFIFYGSGEVQWWDDPHAKPPVNKSSSTKDCESKVVEASTVM